MPLAPEHLHKLRRYSFRNQRQWNCLTPFCKHVTRNPLDLFGTLVSCTNPQCGNTFRFEEADVKQKEADVQCPICTKSTDDKRIVETTYLNSVTQAQALEQLSREAGPKKPILNPSEVDVNQVADIVIADLIKENLENS